MLLQARRPAAKVMPLLTKHRRIAGRIAPHHSVTIRLAPHRGPSRPIESHSPISPPHASDRRTADLESDCDSTLLPWADPYIASLHRRHEGELRRERHQRI